MAAQNVAAQPDGAIVAVAANGVIVAGGIAGADGNGVAAGGIVPPAVPVHDMNARVPLTRLQVQEVLQWQAVGTLITLEWRYCRTLDDDESPWVLWSGNCRATTLNDAGVTVSAEIHWDAGSPQMAEGGILIFPLPMIGGRYAEYTNVLRVRRPAAIPNIAMFGRRVGLDGEEGAAGRGPRHEGPIVPAIPVPAQGVAGVVVAPGVVIADADAAENVNLALRGEAPRKSILRTGVTPKLRIPAEVPPHFNAFYLNFYIESINGTLLVPPKPAMTVANQWATDLDSAMNRFGISTWSNSTKRSEYFACRDSIISWLSSSPQGLDTKMAWTTPFNLAIQLMSLLAMALGGYNEERTCATYLRTNFEGGFIDFRAAFNLIVQGQAPTQGQKKDSAPDSNANGNRGRGSRGRGGQRGF